ncbi:hypothetical protein SAMD00019534_041570, partial [Acytostelium subglobosum LB1]|uniref:hypothetical protein n=1 Tax=Acytostelium subglobosum LB1 TaxID=1410327 RepID=UPI000644F66B
SMLKGESTLFRSTRDEMIWSLRGNVPIAPNDIERSVDADIKNKIKTFTFGPAFNSPIGECCLPDTITTLILGFDFNQDIIVDTLPPSLTSLYIDTYYNNLIESGALPRSLLKLIFYNNFIYSSRRRQAPNKCRIPKLPRSLTHLEFGSCFNCPINAPGYLPESLTILQLGESFNQYTFNSLSTLPQTVKRLSLGLGGNLVPQLTPGVLPTMLESLSVYQCDSPIMPGVLPPSLTLAVFFDYNQPLQHGSLPDSLTELLFILNFNQELLPGVLPTSLLLLNLGARFAKPLHRGVLPPNLKTLIIEEDYLFKQRIDVGVLPQTLKLLKLGDGNLMLGERVGPHSAGNVVYLDKVIAPMSLPSGITGLTLGGGFNNVLTSNDHLPDTLTELTLGRHFNYPIKTVLPQSITKIKFGDMFNQTISPNTLPSSLISVNFGHNFNLVITLPDTLRELTIGGCYDKPLNLPPNLRTLRMYQLQQIKYVASSVSTPDVIAINPIYGDQLQTYYQFDYNVIQVASILPFNSLSLEIKPSVSDDIPYRCETLLSTLKRIARFTPNIAGYELKCGIAQSSIRRLNHNLLLCI